MFRQPSNRNYALIIFLILILVPLNQLPIDIYLPSLPAMTKSFMTTKAMMQWTVSAYILGSAIATLLWGPLSDRFGRRKILLFCLGVFIFSTLGVLWTHRAASLLIFRILQGLGVGGVSTIYFAIIADVFQGKKLTRVTNYSTILYGAVPIIAPFFGGYIQHFWGWRANFILMLIYGLLAFFFYIFLFSETHLNRNPKLLQPKILRQNFLRVLKNPVFVGYVICMTLGYAIMITINVIGPFILQTTLGLTATQYGQMILLVGVGYVIGTVLNHHVSKKMNANPLIFLGNTVVIICGLIMLILQLFGIFTIWTVIIPTFFAILGTGFVFPNGMSQILKIFPAITGISVAIAAFLILLGNTIISLLVSLFHVYNIIPLALMNIVLGSCSIIVLWLLVTRKQIASGCVKL